jgi:uncharacterized protein YaaQ
MSFEIGIDGLAEQQINCVKSIIDDNFISKQKVKEAIEKLKNKKTKYVYYYGEVSITDIENMERDLGLENKGEEK